MTQSVTEAAEKLKGCIVKTLTRDEHHTVMGGGQPCSQCINHHPTLLRSSDRVNFKDKDLS